MRRIILGAFVAVLVLVPATGHAVVPPRDCGKTTVRGKAYQIKVDQISCAQGRRDSRRFLISKRKPKGYRCRTYASKPDRVRFYCNRGVKVFFAIRR